MVPWREEATWTFQQQDGRRVDGSFLAEMSRECAVPGTVTIRRSYELVTELDCQYYDLAHRYNIFPGHTIRSTKKQELRISIFLVGNRQIMGSQPNDDWASRNARCILSSGVSWNSEGESPCHIPDVKSDLLLIPWEFKPQDGI